MEEKSKTFPCISAARWEFGFGEIAGIGIACSCVQPCDDIFGWYLWMFTFWGWKRQLREIFEVTLHKNMSIIQADW